jgi:hypothetical protein
MRLILALFVMAFASPLLAQDIVHEVSRLEWDQDDASIVEEWRMYCENTPGVVPDMAGGSNRVGAIPQAAGQEWQIVLPIGDWYCVVTAAIPSVSLESAPSNEWFGRVVRLQPQNLRKK